jgi:hypothetical protein
MTLANELHPIPESPAAAGIPDTPSRSGQEQAEVLGPDYLNEEDHMEVDVSDGMGALPFSEGDTTFFGNISILSLWIACNWPKLAGPSSNISFIRDLSETVSALRCASKLPSTPFSRPINGGHASSSPPPTPTSVPTGRLGTTKTAEVNPFALPKHSQVMAILETYVEEVYPFFPFLHLPTWMDTYERAVQEAVPWHEENLTKCLEHRPSAQEYCAWSEGEESNLPRETEEC